MNVLLVSSRFAPSEGGVQRHVQALAEGLVRHGHDVTVWTHQLDGTASTETMSVSGSTNVIQVRRFPLTTHHEHALSSLALRRALRDETAEFDVIHVHGYHDTPLLWLRNCAHARVMVTPHYHGDSASRLRSLVHPIYRHIVMRSLNRARRVGCVSGAEQERFLDAFADYRDRCVRTSNGVSVAPGRPSVRTRDRTGAHMALYVGRLETYKRVDRLIRSAAHLPRGWSVDIVGDGPEREALARLITEMGLDDVVTLYGHVDDDRLETLVERATVGVSLSEHEAQGIAVLDFLSRGVPVLTSDIGAFREIASDIGGVHLVDESDSDLLVARAIEVAAAVEAPAEGWKVPTWDDTVVAVERAYESMLAA